MSPRYRLTLVENRGAFQKRSPNDVRAFYRVFLVVSLADRPRRSWESGADYESKRNQTVTRITGVTKFSQGLISMLTTLWVVVSSQHRLVFCRIEAGCVSHLLRRPSQSGSSLIRYRFADMKAGWSPRRLTPRFWCWTVPFDKSGAVCGQFRERRLNSLHALDLLSDISCRTASPPQPWRGLRQIV
jgi:hypothetical protein